MLRNYLICVAADVYMMSPVGIGISVCRSINKVLSWNDEEFLQIGIAGLAKFIANIITIIIGVVVLTIPYTLAGLYYGVRSLISTNAALLHGLLFCSMDEAQWAFEEMAKSSIKYFRKSIGK